MNPSPSPSHLLHLLPLSLLLAARLAAAPTESPPEREERVDQSIERALAYLATSQRPDGTFDGTWGDYTGVIGLVGMAFLSKGYLPGEGRYGENIDRCFDFIVAKAATDGYLGGPDGRMYSHGISTLFFSELSGMIDSNRQAIIDNLLPKAAHVILSAQKVPKSVDHQGGWRYGPGSSDSDLSCSGWALMALRSARLNGAPVPTKAIDDAVAYVLRRHSPTKGSFGYTGTEDNSVTQTGNGLLCLELCGRHGHPATLRAAHYLSQVYTQIPHQNQSMYGLYYAAQGLFQIGGDTWREFSRWMYDYYIPRQTPSGAWTVSNHQVYSTAMCVLAFTVPYRQLPIYQRDETVDEE
jgi:hypothetical protein